MTLVTPQAVPDVLLIEPKKFGDERGFFSETYNAKVLAEAGFAALFVQDNHSRSPAKGTVRGLHFQAPPFAQDKLLRVTRGAILDVAVDIRKGSPTYGQSVAVELSAENWRQLLVPKGFAHGFQTLTEDCEVLYKVTDYYAPASEAGLLWNDPALGIAWPGIEPVINARDAAWPALADFKTPFA
ncbi:MAG: dTDP-4-dehydrorhamnose 3,5-epimerase [Caulobacter vibrioides]|uniref:dTDP-4-dehydrorhamnose 3,5-epimerase n=1 Tax=Caulobacter vibrioides TaxID=155892 RepID=A0A258DAG3_CAUVI|nr:MAG: dTDP-4-dehydrorhamnose 3,5-epimerase [Caulobacter vibrioides]